LNRLFWALLGAAPLVAMAQGNYAIAPVPVWVRQEVPDIADRPAREAADGIEYLAVDRQIRLTPQGSDTYSEFVQRLVSEAGVAELSSISFDFDPHSDRLVLHQLQVRRGALVIDQLRKARITVLQRERGLEQGLLDGTLTLTAVLEDIRPGDIVAYSFTMHTNDPVLGNRYNDSFTTQWASPVRWSRIRLIQPENRVIHVDQVGDNVQPVMRRDGSTKETIWQWRDLAGIRGEKDRPSWHMQYPRLRLSEWSSWKAVVDWSLPLYRRAPLTPPLQALVDEWRKESADDAGRIILALRFVQDQVRYTGIEIGPGAYQPTDPGRVLERRYGDCKDKALLLVTLLAAMNIEAQPALVNTWLGEEIEKVLPGPGLFDHAIVRISNGGRTYWFDASERLQGGTLETANQAHYGTALVVAPGVESLERMPDAVVAAPMTEVTESFDLRAGAGATGTMHVTSIYRGADADTMRRSLQESTSEQLSRSYVDFYRDWYPGIKPAEPLRIEDDRTANRVEVVERYTIDPAFVEEDDGSRRFDVNPHVITTLVKAPQLIERSTPLAVDHPRNVRYKATVVLPQAWTIPNDTVTVEDPAFIYTSKVKAAGRRFVAQYDFRTLANHVDAARVPEYARKLERVRDDASYWFTTATPARLPAGQSINIMVILAVLVGAVGGYALLAFVRRRVPEVRSAAANAPSGIAGWLLLPALHTCIWPISLGRALYHFWPYLDVGMWNSIGSGAGELTVQLLKIGFFTRIAGGIALLMVSCYAILLLFGRRRSYPFTWMLIIWSALVWLVLGWLIVIALPGEDANAALQAGIDVARVFITCLIWTAYMVKSQRVSATFVRDVAIPAQPAAITAALRMKRHD
jgi:Domain of Unknown Function with PDB structure (DUF3857)/Protein of unknown function (DUF2569)